ncbi:MFS transporter [Herbiconiux ginsengi]|uniref:Predicted arabinose efflux permease, MFS family n=1 Tax=Herbiconiux ginsengi TaxID=381665 RepID=A0A1H3LGN4_9MICO|nr:MFS transporter [Herbiconiux ginsengi]SDY63476.1 Predicted arabinose efflux permease, MFS family [Herbiconiux ginsengi]
MSSATTADAPGVTGKPFSWRFTAPLYIGSALNPINSSLIATALVPIATGLGVPIGQTASLVTALYLASAIAQPTAGKVAAVVGARRVFLVGIMLVLLGGALGGVAQNLSMVLIARVLIGLGTSCAYPSAMMLIQRRAAASGMAKPPGSVLGGLQIAGLATAALGLPMGGVLVETAGWRWVFLINVPVALIALAAALIGIPRDPAAQTPGTIKGVLTGIDLIGIAGFGLAMTALLGFLFSLQAPNWLLLAAAVLLFAALTLWELRATSPFLDVRLLVRNGALTRTYLRYALIALCVYVVMYGITQWMEAARGMSALSAGLLLLPMSVISGIVIVPISRRNLIRGPVIVAAVASLAGSVGVLFLTSDTGVAWIVLITVIFGVVLGTASSGNQLALYTQAPPEQLGVASGLFRTFGYLGSIASSAITGIVFHTDATDGGVHTIGLIMIGVSLVAIAFTVFDRTLRTPTRTASPA